MYSCEPVSRRARAIFVLALGIAVGPAIACASSEPSSRAPLDARWDQFMREGRAVGMVFGNSETGVPEYHSSEWSEDAGGRPEAAAWTKSRTIAVARMDQGFWKKNGGWELVGGLLGRASADSSTVELYGKAAVRVFPHFPFPFHRDIPHETGYEFFLLLREPGVPLATIVRRWAFEPNEVVVNHESTGGTSENVRAMLLYDESARTATVTITGLKRPFADRVDLSGLHR